jgi:hypothetical protein
MTNTGYYELDRLPAKCANAYIYDGNRKEYYTNIYSVDVKGTGAGGGFTTVIDINTGSTAPKPKGDGKIPLRLFRVAEQVY